MTLFNWRKGEDPIPVILKPKGLERNLVLFPEDAVRRWLANRPKLQSRAKLMEMFNNDACQCSHCGRARDKNMLPIRTTGDNSITKSA